MYYIYWIKRKTHTNILKEGYIGFSNNVQRRYLEHSSGNSIVSKNIQKYDDIDVIILFEFINEQEALDKEKELRPSKRIGWNIAVGGQIPPSTKGDKDIAKKISETLKNKKITPYSEKTHSPEALEKSRIKKQEANRKMYHNPITGEYKFIALGLGELVPEGWVPGRVAKNNIIKVRGKDYICNTKKFKVIDPNGDEYIVENNFKQWCKIKNIAYLSGCRKMQWKGWKAFVL
jgi:predicted GIY-YIG superfamily endonuclease